jgi:hypothetical protein
MKSRLFDDQHREDRVHRRQRELLSQHNERLFQEKWFWYAKAWGVFLPDALETWFYSDQQKAFFAEYEKEF